VLVYTNNHDLSSGTAGGSNFGSLWLLNYGSAAGHHQNTGLRSCHGGRIDIGSKRAVNDRFKDLNLL